MPILFSAVACDNIIISNFASCDGNFREIIEQVLTKIPHKNEKMTYSHGHFLFHYIIADKYVYFCITDKLCQRSRAFLFLNEIRRRFTDRHKNDFTAVLAAEMYRYSDDNSTINIRKGELDELNSIGVDCSEKLLGEKMLFVNNPENLRFSAISYVGSTPEKVKVSFNDTRSYALVIVIFILVVGIAIYVFGPISSVIFTGSFLYVLYQSVFKT